MQHRVGTRNRLCLVVYVSSSWGCQMWVELLGPRPRLWHQFECHRCFIRTACKVSRKRHWVVWRMHSGGCSPSSMRTMIRSFVLCGAVEPELCPRWEARNHPHQPVHLQSLQDRSGRLCAQDTVQLVSCGLVGHLANVHPCFASDLQRFRCSDVP